MITNAEIEEARIRAAETEFVLSVLEDITNGHDYFIPNSCQCGWERMIQSRKPQFTGTWCVHCISVELANLNNDNAQP